MGENSQKGKSLFPPQYLKSLNIYSNYLKSTSYVIKHLPEFKNLNQTNNVVRIKSLRSTIISPAHAKSLLKIVLGHINFILYPISKDFVADFTVTITIQVNAFRGMFQINCMLSLKNLSHENSELAINSESTIQHIQTKLKLLSYVVYDNVLHAL